MKLEWDKEKNIITLGDAVFDEYTNFKNAASFAFVVLAKNNISTEPLKDKVVDDDTCFGKVVKSKYSVKERNKFFGDKLGCSATVLFKHFKKLQTKAFIVPVYDIYKAVKPFRPRSFTKGRWDSSVLKKVNELKGLLKPVEEDGLKHLLPIVYHTEKSPQELKKMYGNSWKSVTKNSVSRNKLIGHNICGIETDKVKRLLRAETPSTLYKTAHTKDVDCLTYLKNNFKGSWGKRDTIYHAVNVYRDTKRMADQLGVIVNPSWTARRMKEEHDKMFYELNARKYSKDILDSVKNIAVQSMEHEGFVATLLQSKWEIADEGNSMGHCVAGYAEAVAAGNYLVYSITKDGERSSTVGIDTKRYKSIPNISYEEELHYALQQQYGKYNTSVKDAAEKQLAQMIVEQLNKELTCTH